MFLGWIEEWKEERKDGGKAAKMDAGWVEGKEEEKMNFHFGISSLHY